LLAKCPTTQRGQVARHRKLRERIGQIARVGIELLERPLVRSRVFAPLRRTIVGVHHVRVVLTDGQHEPDVPLGEVVETSAGVVRQRSSLEAGQQRHGKYEAQPETSNVSHRRCRLDPWALDAARGSTERALQSTMLKCDGTDGARGCIIPALGVRLRGNGASHGGQRQ
jgi:hypothetical protein